MRSQFQLVFIFMFKAVASARKTLRLQTILAYPIFENTASSVFEKDDQNRTKFSFRSLDSVDSQLTPQKLVEYLDHYVIGQNSAKKAIACAFRNRWRRKQLPEQIKSQIIPKNLLLKGPTGSGKTQIARRLAKLTNSPFVRVEATKYTEVGYVGKDVSTIIQDLAKIGVNNYKTRMEKVLKELSETVKNEVYLQILDAMVGESLPEELKQKKLKDLKLGHYNQQIITIMPGYKPNLDIQYIYLPQKAITKSVKQLGIFLYNTYYEKLKSQYANIDVQKEAILSVEEDGIVFLDEIDKLAVAEGPLSSTGKGVSTEGVQRDLLPLIEGTTVSTKFGDVKTDHILFIASGSFSMAKVQDLIPQLLGRLPIKVHLDPISKAELVRILKEPDYNLIFQQKKLLETEQLELIFTQDAIEEIAEQAYQMNLLTENLGARRLHAIIEKVMEQISFTATSKKGQKVVIDQAYVKERLKDEVKSIDLRKYLI